MQEEWFIAIKMIYLESSITRNICEILFWRYKSQIKSWSKWNISALAPRRRLAHMTACDTRDCLMPGVVALHIPPSGATTTDSHKKSTQSCYNMIQCVSRYRSHNMTTIWWYLWYMLSLNIFRFFYSTLRIIEYIKQKRYTSSSIFLYHDTNLNDSITI